MNANSPVGLPHEVAVVGRFPPPLDGQAVATAALADVLSKAIGVRRINLSAPENDVRADAHPLRRAGHYLGSRGHIRRSLADAPYAPAIWTTISPKPMGHLRDLATVVSPLGRRAIVAVVHHGDFHQLFSSPATRTSALRLVRRLSGIVFNTPGLAERCAPWVPDEKRFVCPNTTSAHTHLSDEAFRARRTERTDGSPIRLLYLSGMIPSKGYLDVLETVGVLCQRGVAVRATFAGRWPNANAEAAFQARTEALGVTSVVEHLGGVSDRYAVRELYLNADAFVLPTTYPTEAHPLTIMESLNAGTPVIATAHASIPEMIEDGRSGLLIPPHAPSALADAVEYLSDLHTWRSFSVAARARYVSHFAPTIVRAWWLALLGQLVTKAP